MLPEVREAEILGGREESIGQTGCAQLVDAYNLDSTVSRADHMPETSLDDEAERANGKGRLVRDGQLDVTPLLDAAGEASQLAVRYMVSGPRIGIVQQPGREPVGVVREA